MKHKLKNSQPEFGEPFITGSHAYGTPTTESDIDLVIRIHPNDFYFLQHRSEYREGLYGIRFGKLNLICCISEHEYEVWFKGTVNLIERKPVTRKEAIIEFNKIREQYGLTLSAVPEE